MRRSTLDQVEDCLCTVLGQLIRQPETVPSIACFDWLNTLSMRSNQYQTLAHAASSVSFDWSNSFSGVQSP